ncbi:MAG: response regulator [Dehalococcoidaceae bacterium]|nr:response regulator [Dehalococcoidaceae bacterium]
MDTKKRILVVDDEAAIRRIVGTGLRIFGYDVITSSNGEEALRLVESEKPDLMLLDVLMPGMSGFETLKILRAKSDLPVVVFSARTSSREEALKLGANDFIAKPFVPEQMAKRISLVLQANSN